jgi:hypothetical protein
MTHSKAFPHRPRPDATASPPSAPTRSLLRDYFDAEFRAALEGRMHVPPRERDRGRGKAGEAPAGGQPPPGFHYDLERVVDDFVLFCMLVGNDFLPPLPTVDINEGGWLRGCAWVGGGGGPVCGGRVEGQRMRCRAGCA